MLALRGVSFSVRRGELVVIVGPSGSGKSTLLHVIGTLERPSSGVVRIGGVDAAQLSDRSCRGCGLGRSGSSFSSSSWLNMLRCGRTSPTGCSTRASRPPSGTGARTRRSNASASPNARHSSPPSCSSRQATGTASASADRRLPRARSAPAELPVVDLDVRAQTGPDKRAWGAQTRPRPNPVDLQEDRISAPTGPERGAIPTLFCVRPCVFAAHFDLVLETPRAPLRTSDLSPAPVPKFWSGCWGRRRIRRHARNQVLSRT